MEHDHTNGPLPTMDRSARLGRLRDRLAADDTQALVVTKPQNIRWLTGFTGSAGTVVVTEDELTLITDDRYRTRAAQELEQAEVTADIVIDRDLGARLPDAVGSASYSDKVLTFDSKSEALTICALDYSDMSRVAIALNLTSDLLLADFNTG